MGFFLGGTRKPFVPGREDWALLCIAASGRRLLPIQLQKVLHLVGRRFPALDERGFYQFRSISSGHFSEAIYADAAALAKSGLVSIDYSERDGLQHYRATRAGLERAKKLEKHLRPEVVQYLHNVVTWASSRSVDQLLRGSLDPNPPARPGLGRSDPPRLR
ncbi:MAG TPA: hypothetical protein VGK08_03450 [Thermoanaerobaculia bacterium]